MRDHGLLHSLPRLAGACSLILLVGAPTPARGPRTEEALLWVRSGERLLALDLETGREVSEEELDGASRLLRDPQGLGYPTLSTPAGLRDLASGAQLGGPDVGLGQGHFTGSAWRVLTAGRLERLSKDGPLEQSEALPDGVRALALTDDALWLARGSEIVRRSLDDGSEAVSRLQLGDQIVADCVDPLTGNLVAAVPAGVAWITPSGSLATWAHRTGVVDLACGTDGAPVALLPDRVVRLRTVGAEAESEEIFRLPADLGTARRIEADPRDGAIVVAAGPEIVRWTPDGSLVWRIRTDDPVAELAAGWPERRSPRAAGRPDDRLRAEPQKRSPAPPNGGPEAPDVDPDQIVFAGRVVDPSWRPVEAADVVAFGRDVARTTTAADGTFELPALPYQSGDAVLLQASKTVPAGTATSFPATFTGTPGTTQSVGDRMADFACPVNFDVGLFPANELDNQVRAVAVFDDGAGPALYVGGTFTTAGGITVNRVAKWDGSGWSALGSGLGGGTSPSVDALLVFDDGSGPALYAGGKFTTSGAAAVKYVARWTGSQWVQVGNALNNQVLALAGFDSGSGPALYATGSFTKAGSTTVNRIARLSGSTWVTMGSGLNNTGRALASYGGQLHVGGSFTTAGGVSAARIARWNGSTWSALGSGVSGGSSIQVDALTTWDDGTGEVLVAGGRFTSAGGSTVNHIARWDGSSWSSFDTGLAVLVDAVATFDDGFGPSLYAAGTFTGTPDAGTLNRVARWSGFGWTPIGENSVGVNGSALALAGGTIDGTAGLYLGGAFTSADGTAAGHLARIVRPNDCTDYWAPRLKIVDPSPGETVATTTPAIRVGFVDFGGGADTATSGLHRQRTALRGVLLLRRRRRGLCPDRTPARRHHHALGDRPRPRGQHLPRRLGDLHHRRIGSADDLDLPADRGRTSRQSAACADDRLRRRGLRSGPEHTGDRLERRHDPARLFDHLEPGGLRADRRPADRTGRALGDGGRFLGQHLGPGNAELRDRPASSPALDHLRRRRPLRRRITRRLRDRLARRPLFGLDDDRPGRHVHFGRRGAGRRLRGRARGAARRSYPRGPFSDSSRSHRLSAT